jgi:hypothetical protein
LPLPRPLCDRILLGFLISVALLALNSSIKTHADEPRVSAAYTAWDDYFFYVAVEVNDHNVISKNRTPISQPQEDDDVEIFLNTKPGGSNHVRTPDTYQMAVSAGSGCYFSVGDGTKIPKGKVVLTYKYAVTIDGTLNDSSDNDTGFTVELAIPWQELGRLGPPAPGETWGFNVISRDRDSEDVSAQSFATLSNAVKSAADIQDPTKWSKIQFISTLASQSSGPAMVFCPHVQSNTNYPVIDGVVRSGEWASNYGFSFGDAMIAGAAPTKGEEPNITQSPFATVLQPVVQTPVVAVAPPPTTPTGPTTHDYTLTLPGGGEIHVGKLKVTPPPPVIPQPTTVGSGHHKFLKYPGSNSNPLAPNLPPPVDVSSTIGPQIDPNATLSLFEQTNLAPLIVAPYYIDYPANIQPTSLLDQPMDAVGPAFGGLHAAWHENQLQDARKSGIDVLLPVIDPASAQSVEELSALVQAMKEMKAQGLDYPLLGLKVEGSDDLAAVTQYLEIVPAEFRAEVVLPDKMHDQRAYVVVVNSLPSASATQKIATLGLPATNTLLFTTTSGNSYLSIIKVSPGGESTSDGTIGREETRTYSASWDKVYSSNADWVYVDSWNDYYRGTEVAASRQYGEEYADLTKLSALKWSGADEWDAKYLANDAPSIIAQKTIYTVSVRVENNGSLPWRAGENYALCYRWYKDGRLYDDSAPRLPLSVDVYPGQSATLRIGVVAQNSFGKDIEPGEYTLVFDMVQGQSRWFTYVGSRPLRVPVRVTDKIDAPQAKPVLISDTTPSILAVDGSYKVTLSIRNEGQETWDPKNTTVALGGNGENSIGTFSSPIYPGAVGQITTTIRIPSDEPVGKIGTLEWTIKTPGTSVNWTEHPLIVHHDLGASFSINDISRTMKTNEVVDGKVAIYNTGPYSWTKKAWRIGYEWLYLDGITADKPSIAGELIDDTDPEVETATSISLKTPAYPGKYQLVLFMQDPAGNTTLDESATRGSAVLPMLVTVSEGKSSSASTVDISKYFNGNGIGRQSTDEKADFDGKGDSLPAAFMPPDGTQELNVNPMLVGKPGPPEYPSGYYSSSVGVDAGSNHRIAFLYGAKYVCNMIVCKGQRITLPDGDWKTVHILAASTSDSGSLSAQIELGYKDGDSAKTIRFASWTKVPDPATATVAMRLPYKLNHGKIAADGPVFLADYPVSTDDNRKLQTLVLPSDSNVKVLAVTLER